MPSELADLCIDAQDPAALARFWAGVLGRELVHRADGPTLPPEADNGVLIRFGRTDRRKVDRNQLHFDVTSQTSDRQDQTVARALALGGTHVDVGQTGDEGHVVLADPEGNEFCVIEAGNGFLAGCGVVGALNCDGTQAVGYFWSAALGWPLVWDQDQETAIQSPRGGPKITWSGPPLMPKTGPNRMRFELAATGDLAAEVGRVVGLGAIHLDGDPAGGMVRLADPDGNDFCLRRA